MYRIGYPFWKILGGVSIPLKLRVDIIHDEELMYLLPQARTCVGWFVRPELLTSW